MTHDYPASAKELLEPILAVFSGEDGGVAFAKLRHHLLPELMAKLDGHPTTIRLTHAEAKKCLDDMERFSHLCKTLLADR